MMANEKRLIDVDAFRDHWNKNYRHQYANDTFLFALANFPTVDAVEVVHAQWLYDGGSGCYFCSACDEYAIVQLCRDLDGIEYYEECLTNYCPNCGAKMDGDGNG